MVDQEWLRNLATARYVDGQWELAEPEQHGQIVADRISDAIESLYEKAEMACDSFNQYSGGRRSMRILPIKSSYQGKSGFLILCGSSQVSLESTPPILQISLAILRGFQRQCRPLFQLSPQVDPFGGILWAADNGLLMTHDLIIKYLMEHVASAAAANGEF